MSCPPFYLNMLILNKAEVLESKVTEKVGRGMLGLGLAQKAATKVASKLCTDEKFATAVATKLVDAIPPACAERGINVTVEQRFAKGAYVVLRVHVTEVDKATLLTSAKGEEFARKFAELMALLDYFEAGDAKEKVEAGVLTKVQASLMEKLAEILPPKLLEVGGVEVELIAKSDAEQAEFFYQFLAEQQDGIKEASA